MQQLSSFIPSAIGTAATNGGVVGMPDPNTGAAKDPVRLTPLSFKSTFDEDFKKKNPFSSAMNSYQHKFQPEHQLPYHIGAQYGRPMLNGGVNFLSNWFNQGAAGAGGMGALGGGLLGYLGASGLNFMRGEDSVDPTRAAMLGALGGGLFGGTGGWIKDRVNSGNVSVVDPGANPTSITPQTYIDYFKSMGVPTKAAEVKEIPVEVVQPEPTNTTKSADWRDGSSSSFRDTLDEADQIIAIIRKASGLSSTEKSKMMQAVDSLSNSDIVKLKQLVGASSGAAAGAIIARFLLNRGLIGTLVGALAGGVVGGSMFGGRSSGSSTFLGQPLSL